MFGTQSNRGSRLPEVSYAGSAPIAAVNREVCVYNHLLVLLVLVLLIIVSRV
jgi:hypothetical protein